MDAVRIMNVYHSITRELLVFVRDTKPTAEQLTAWLSTRQGEAAYHVLKKAGLLVEFDGRLSWNENHLLANGQLFKWTNMLWYLDEDRVDLVAEHPPAKGFSHP